MRIKSKYAENLGEIPRGARQQHPQTAAEFNFGLRTGGGGGFTAVSRQIGNLRGGLDFNLHPQGVAASCLHAKITIDDFLLHPSPPPTLHYPPFFESRISEIFLPTRVFDGPISERKFLFEMWEFFTPPFPSPYPTPFFIHYTIEDARFGKNLQLVNFSFWYLICTRENVYSRIEGAHRLGNETKLKPMRFPVSFRTSLVRTYRYPTRVCYCKSDGLKKNERKSRVPLRDSSFVCFRAFAPIEHLSKQNRGFKRTGKTERERERGWESKRGRRVRRSVGTKA